MKLFKNILALVFSVVLVVSLVILPCSISLKKNIFSSSFYIDRFNTYKVYDKLEKSIDYKLYSAVTKNKLPTYLSNNVIDNKWVVVQCTTIVNGMIAYMERKTDTLPVISIKQPLAALNNNWSEGVKKGDLPESFSTKSDTASAKTGFFSTITNLPFSQTWSDNDKQNFQNSIMKYRKIIPNISSYIYISIVCTILSIILLWICCEKLGNFKTWTCYSIIFAGLFTALGGFFAANTALPDTLAAIFITVPDDALLSAKTVHTVVSDMLSSLFFSISKYGALIVLAGILLLVIISLFDNERQRVFHYKMPLKFKNRY